MNILLTNDDGIHAPGLLALYKIMRRNGTVTVVAPESERSSVSHGITLFQPLWCKKTKFAGTLPGYAVSGTPADCVKFGVRMILKKKPDLVISGINQGENDGCSVFYSGTVAAAREAALMGIPAMAISLATFERSDFTFAAKIASQLVKFLRTHELPPGTFLNVNVPCKPRRQIKGMLLTRQGIEPIHTQFRRKSNPLNKEYFWMTGKVPTSSKDMAIDTCALSHDYVTVTPLQCDMTAEALLATWPRVIHV